MEIRIIAKCPYCKMENNVLLNFENIYFPLNEIICCDLESGGCDKHFAVRVGLSPIVKISEIYFK